MASLGCEVAEVVGGLVRRRARRTGRVGIAGRSCIVTFSLLSVCLCCCFGGLFIFYCCAYLCLFGRPKRPGVECIDSLLFSRDTDLPEV